MALTDLLSGQYRWALQLTGLSLIVATRGIYLSTNAEACSVDAAVWKRRGILNLLAPRAGATMADLC